MMQCIQKALGKRRNFEPGMNSGRPEFMFLAGVSIIQSKRRGFVATSTRSHTCLPCMPPSESIPSDLDTSEEEREYERKYAQYLRKLDRYNRKQAEIRYVHFKCLSLTPELTRSVSEREEAQRRVHAIQNKRDQWKAASARYYEKHPEVKEKKRLQAAEKRCGDGRPLI